MSDVGKIGWLLLGILLGAGTVAGLWAWAGDSSSDPLPETNRVAAVPDAPDPVADVPDPAEPDGDPPEPADPPTEPVPAPKDAAVHARLCVPDGTTLPRLVSAWRRDEPDDIYMCYPARIVDRVLITRVPPGRGQIKFHVPEFVSVEFDYSARAGSENDVGEITLARATLLSGRVLDADGTPIKHACVMANVGEHTVPLTVSREDGTFSFDGLPSGKARLRVTSDGFVRQTVFYASSPGADPIEVVLLRGGRLRGFVLDQNGKPAPDTYVWIIDPADEKNRDRMAWPTIEDDGSFMVNLSAGRYEVHGIEDEIGGVAEVVVREGKTSEVTLQLAE